MASETLQDLREHLKEMFQFDNELDFGIYKVLRLKRQEVSRFLDEELEAIVDEVLAGIECAGETQRTARLAAFVKERGGKDERRWLEDPTAHADELQEFIEYKLRDDAERRSELLTVLREVKEPHGDGASELEDRVYNHLIAFFGRYYRNGDFGYNDRSLATYKIDYPPAEADYDGSDVLLHWKHKDSFYVKTAASFPTVRFELDGETIEYRLETGGTASLARNNNKGDVKHYRLDRIERDDETGAWRVVFHLDQTSTPKIKIFPEIMEKVFGHGEDLDRYLFRKPGKKEEQGKPIFSDLEGDYDRVQNGQKKAEGEGRGGLRTSCESYRKLLAGRDEFKELGSNVDSRVAALEDDATACRLYVLDKHLNTFYLGVDADYFIHKNLHGFLTREAERYIKDTILRGVSGSLPPRKTTPPSRSRRRSTASPSG